MVGLPYRVIPCFRLLQPQRIPIIHRIPAHKGPGVVAIHQAQGVGRVPQAQLWPPPAKNRPSDLSALRDALLLCIDDALHRLLRASRLAVRIRRPLGRFFLSAALPRCLDFGPTLGKVAPIWLGKMAAQGWDAVEIRAAAVGALEIVVDGLDH